MKRRTVLLLLAAGLVLCAADLVAQKAAGPVPLGLPPLIVPAHNPQTPEKIALGMKLFNDKRFSSTGEVNCAMCHEPDKAFTDSPLQVSEGINKLMELGTPLRSSMPHILTSSSGTAASQPRRPGTAPIRESRGNGA